MSSNSFFLIFLYDFLVDERKFTDKCLKSYLVYLNLNTNLVCDTVGAVNPAVSIHHISRYVSNHAINWVSNVLTSCGQKRGKSHDQNSACVRLGNFKTFEKDIWFTFQYSWASQAPKKSRRL